MAKQFRFVIFVIICSESIVSFPLKTGGFCHGDVAAYLTSPASRNEARPPPQGPRRLGHLGLRRRTPLAIWWCNGGLMVV